MRFKKYMFLSLNLEMSKIILTPNTVPTANNAVIIIFFKACGLSGGRFGGGDENDEDGLDSSSGIGFGS